jgi:hypothetical protein
MSGILDNRTRIMDTIVTLEGRRQMADGKLRIEYVSFTDNSTFYDPDVVSGSADATNRLYFEQCHLPQDQITFEADDSGRLKPFKNSKNVNVSNSGKIFVSSSADIEFLTGTEFTSTAEDLIASSINNFNNLQAIGTKDYVFENEGFELGPSEISYTVNYNIKNGKEEIVNNFNENFLETRNLEEFPSLFNSKWLENVINFKYLPPINKNNDKSIDKSNISFLEANKIGNYQNLKSDKPYDYVSIEKDLANLEKNGLKKSITFDPTSLNNNLVSQFLEISNVEMQKLDVIDYGTYINNGKTKHMFFVGKIKTDVDDSQCFINLFTLVFE